MILRLAGEKPISRQKLAEAGGGFVINLLQAADVPVVLQVCDLHLDGNLESGHEFVLIIKPPPVRFEAGPQKGA